MRKTEVIHQALLTLLQAVADYTVKRNEPLTSFEGKQFVSLIDGVPGRPVEEFFNPPLFEFQAVASLVVATEGSDVEARDLWVDAAITAFGAVLEGDPSLGGLVTSIRATLADVESVALFGAADISAAQIDISLDYHTDSSLG